MTTNAEKNIGIETASTIAKIYEYIMDHQSHYKTKILCKLSELEPLRRENFQFIPIFKSEPHVVVFMKINDVFYSIMLNKKYMGINNPNRICLIPIDVKSDRELYQGSIFDGFYYSKHECFVVNDIHFFKGGDVRLQNITHKLTEFTGNKEQLFRYEGCTKPLYFRSNKLCNRNNIKELIQTYTEPIIGLQIILKNNILFSYHFDEIDYIYIKSIINNSKYIFTMIKTKIADSYKLQNDHGEDIGIACVPNIKMSNLYREWFANITQPIKVECEYNNILRKWTPVKKILRSP